MKRIIIEDMESGQEQIMLLDDNQFNFLFDMMYSFLRTFDFDSTQTKKQWRKNEDNSN